MIIDIGQSLFGLVGLTCIAWLISENRKLVKVKDVAIGLALQLILALFLLKVPYSTEVFSLLNRAVMALQEATDSGTSFVFGYLGGGSLPFVEKTPGASFILAFRALPLILIVSALSSLLFYWRVMPFVVRLFSRMLQKTMNIGGALGVGAAANIFVGMIEAPLFIRPYLAALTRSELFTIMTCGMATIAGTVMVLYASILQDVVPGVMGHILVASIISAPAAITVAKVMVPEECPPTDGEIAPAQQATGAMDAIAKGTADGIIFLINITAMLIVLVALVHLVNQILTLLPEISGRAITLERIFGYGMAPIVWLMGIPWQETLTAGSLMGTKTVMNEFLAYLQLSNLAPGALSPRSTMIMIYAMCGFANFGSLGIMIGGLGAMAPERRSEIVGLGIKAIVAGTIATCMTGAVVGMFY
ncbi:MAG: nucleoside:proton symporter [Desulfobulbaceae bacterium]|nr:nucleoside:proton symporter [Desulfobulbaceae bacterium]